MTMARMTVQGTPYSKTVQPQYQGSGINTESNTSGTPAHSQAGNPATTRRVVSADTYGKVMSGAQGNANDPSNNGSGIVLDGAKAAGAFDSPVPSGAPVFNPASMDAENRAHLGSGNESAANSTMTAGDGVLARG
jgi:hypothetical protein